MRPSPCPHPNLLYIILSSVTYRLARFSYAIDCKGKKNKKKILKLICPTCHATHLSHKFPSSLSSLRSTVLRDPPSLRYSLRHPGEVFSPRPLRIVYPYASCLTAKINMPGCHENNLTSLALLTKSSLPFPIIRNDPLPSDNPNEPETARKVKKIKWNKIEKIK